MTASRVTSSAEVKTERHSLDAVWVRLDRLYTYCGYLAAFFLVAIFLVTVLQVLTRLIGYNIRGLTDYAGYFMAASAFLAFAHAFNRGAQIRIELFLSMMGRFRFVAECFSFLASCVIALWLAYFAWSTVYWSRALNDVSSSLDATPLWIPQSAMAIGMTMLAISVIDHSLRLLLTGNHRLPASPDAL